MPNKKKQLLKSASKFNLQNYKGYSKRFFFFEGLLRIDD